MLCVGFRGKSLIFRSSDSVLFIERGRRGRDLLFDKGPYGLDSFIEKERRFIQSKKKWDPKGLSFFVLIGFKAFFSLTEKQPSSIDLQHLLHEMNDFRHLYDNEVRQARVQHFELVPSTANFEILRTTTR